MGLAISIFGLAFAACCVWLAVRIVNQGERWQKWTAIGVLAFGLLAYPLSIGPWFWLHRHGYIADQGIPLYAPIQWVEDQSPAVADVVWWYMELWYPPRRFPAN